jgi:hypothetical protein
MVTEDRDEIPGIPWKSGYFLHPLLEKSIKAEDSGKRGDRYCT